MRTWEFWSIGRVLSNRDIKGRFVKGHRHRAEETKEKIRQSLKDTPLTEERKKNISESLKGRISPCGFKGHQHTDLSRQKISKSMSGENNHFYGKHHLEESKRKISLKKRGKRVSIETEFKKGYIPWNKGLKLKEGN